jgi:hypothetical protein
LLLTELAQGVQAEQAAAESNGAEESKQRLADVSEQKENMSKNIALMNQEKEDMSQSAKTFECQLNGLVSDIEQLGVNGVSDVPRIK